MSKMTENYEYLDLDDLISEGDNLQSQLFEVYKNSIENIHQLKQSSKVHMELIANIEDDLGSNDFFSENIELLTGYISDFNILIADQIDFFEEIVDNMIICYSLFSTKYKKDQIPSSLLIKITKQLSFICALINKYKFRVDNLKLMSNSFLYHSEDFEKEHKLYRSNLISLAVILTESIEKYNDLIQKLNLLF